MTYDLTVRVSEDNPNYDAQMKEWREQRQWAPRYDDAPERTTTRTALSVSLTEDQWNAVQKAVLETFR